MKSKLLLLFSILALTSDLKATEGDTFTISTTEGVEMTFVVTNETNKTVRVGDGTNAAISKATTGTFNIPETIIFGENTYNVTSIATNAFKDCQTITSVSIPGSITSIGQSAFSNCIKLKSVGLSEGIHSIGGFSFYNCISLTSITFPSTISSIGGQAFIYCRSIKKIVVNMATPFKFGNKAFSGLNALCGLHVPQGTKNSYIAAGWTNSIFKGGVVEGEDTPTIGNTFKIATEEGVEITYYVTDVDNLVVQVGNGSAACVNASTAGTITIPAQINYAGGAYQVSSIASKAFINCNKIEKVVIPASVKAIGTQAFNGCVSLLSVISRIEDPFVFGENAFTNINQYTGLHVPEETKDAYIAAGWTDEVFPGGIVYGDDTRTRGYSFTSINEDGVEITYIITDLEARTVQVGNGSVSAINSEFEGQLRIPSTVQLEDVTYTVNSIGSKAFYNSTGMTAVTIPESVLSIGSHAFEGCTALKSVYARIQDPFNLETTAFNKVNALCALHVPEGTKNAYIENGWTKSIFKGGVVEGDDAVTNGFTFTSNTTEGIEMLFSVTDIDNFTVQVGDGLSAAIDTLTASGVTIPEKVELNGKTFTVTKLANYAFNECASITNLQIPESVTSLGIYLCNGCSSLKSVNIPSSVTVIPNHCFYECVSLRTIDFPEGLKTIDGYAFHSCLSLTEVIIPEGVTVVGYQSFLYCDNLTKVVIPSTVTSIPRAAFYWDSKLKHFIINVPDPGVFGKTFKEMDIIDYEYFCSNMALHVPEGSIEKYAEWGWTTEMFPGGVVVGADTPTLNDTFTFKTVEGVEVTAFLTNLENHTIQVGLGTSGNPAIDQATQGVVTLPDTVEAFGQKYVITTIGGYAFRYCNDVTEVKIPATVTHIGRYGFGNMDNLEKAVLPDSLIAMETAAFYRDAKLSELKLNEGLQDIGNYSFSYAAISELEIPKSVTNIGRSSFAACENLDKVISRIEQPFEFQSDAFAGISSTCGLHVPEGTKEAYIEQGWTEETFPGGIVYGDETLHKGQSFDVTEEDGTRKTFRVTDVNEMKAEMVSVTAGSEAGGTVTLMPTATHELTGNVYTVSNIADKAFGADVKKVLSRIETPFAVSSAAFASLSPMCSLHVPAGTKAAYLENGWTEESFKAGVVEGDDTLVKGQTFTLTDEDGTSTTYRVTDVNDNLVEIVSAKEGEEADGSVSIQQAVTDPVAGNDYTVASISNGAFNENLKAVTAEAETPYPVTPEAFKGIGDKCVLFVPAGTKDAYIENGWTEDIFKGGIYEGNIPGDVNEDLAVDISDIVAVINTIADPEGSAYRYADVNGDSNIDISDIVKIINIIAEK